MPPSRSIVTLPGTYVHACIVRSLYSWWQTRSCTRTTRRGQCNRRLTVDGCRSPFATPLQAPKTPAANLPWDLGCRTGSAVPVHAHACTLQNGPPRAPVPLAASVSRRAGARARAPGLGLPTAREADSCSLGTATPARAPGRSG
jgi:hypothetical protein